MTATETAALRALLIVHEGRRLKPYRDTKGKITIGIGHNLTDRGLTDAQVDGLFADDLAEVEIEVAAALPWVGRLRPVAYRVVIDVAFNAGVTGLLGFHQMLAALQRGDDETAAREVVNSALAPARAQRLAHLLRS